MFTITLVFCFLNNFQGAVFNYVLYTITVLSKCIVEALQYAVTYIIRHVNFFIFK